MLEKLLDYEREVFFFLNGSDSIYLDHFMWLFSSKHVWIPLAIFILFVLIYKKNKADTLLLLFSIVLVITLCDQFASHFCKPFFERFRPTHHPNFMNEVQTVFGYRSGLYGFISSHSANSFGFAMFISMLFRNKLVSFIFFIWAFFTAYTRIYLGVHFISDVTAGALAGLFFGYLVYYLFEYARYKIRGRDIPQPENLYSEKEKQTIIYAIMANTVLMIIFNIPLVHILRGMLY